MSPADLLVLVGVVLAVAWPLLASMHQVPSDQVGVVTARHLARADKVGVLPQEPQIDHPRTLQTPPAQH